MKKIVKMMSTFKWLNENLSQPGKGKEWQNDEAKRRVKNAPKQQKRWHIPSTVDGNLEQLMLDVNDWKTVNWSEKAKEYQIRRKGASVPSPNAGQVLKEYLKSWGVNPDTFDQKKRMDGWMLTEFAVNKKMTNNIVQEKRNEQHQELRSLFA